MNIPRVMIAAPKSGSGKTMVTCALLQALKNRGKQVFSFKCGPDYIDSMFHRKVLGVSSKNLDTFFTSEEQTRQLFLDSVKKGQGEDGNKEGSRNRIAVFEGVMGLFDGLGGVREEGSSYHLAKVTKTPVILVADVKGVGRSMIPFLRGFLDYDRERLIRGVILNRISKGYFEVMKPLIEEELGICVLGFLPEKEELRIGSRHLGLVLPEEVDGIREKIQAASEEMERTISVEEIVRIGEEAKELGEDGGRGRAEGDRKTEGSPGPRGQEDRPVIAVARDEAFCFYYEHNLLMLEEYGAKLAYFSPIHDKKLPDNCHGLLLGGGYPELYGKRLSENAWMRESIKQAMEKGMPVVAECGGFMYLHSAMIDKEGIRFEMAGLIPAVCFDTKKLVRFGYIEVQDKEGHFLPKGEKIKGHEFHYYDSTSNGDDGLAIKPLTGKTYSCIMAGRNYWFGFPHLYYPSNPKFAESFVEKVRRYWNIWG